MIDVSLRKYLLPIFCAFCWNIHQLSAQTVRGRVVSKDGGLPFVSIGVVGSSKGVLTDEKGYFTFKNSGHEDSLKFSCVGYQSVTLKNTTNMLVEMLEESSKINEVVIRFVNPAHRIINLAVQNKPINDPENLISFGYHAYNKTVVFADKKQLFVSESITNRKFIRPNLSKETIEATNTSGTSSTILATASILLQPFGFYKDHITLQGRRIQEQMNYLNPVSAGSQNRYDFFLADTLINPQGDSTFVIEFEPQKNKGFEGLKGVLHINSDRYAIEYVQAKPAEESLLLSFSIEQKYEKIGASWFPAELFSNWSLPEFQYKKQQLYFTNKTILNNVELNIPINPTIFDEKSLVIAPDAAYKDAQYWNENRLDSLSLSDKNTFDRYDSMSSFKRFKVNAGINLSEWFIAGVIPISKKLDLATQNLFDSNRFEGFRPTLNILTSENFSKKIKFDIKLGYGFKDKAYKYEGRLRINLNEANRTKLTLAYRNDISEPSNVQYFIWNFPQIPYELIRTFLISRADKLEQYKAELNFRALKYGTVSLSFVNESRAPTYDYQFSGMGYENMMSRKFSVVEVGAGIRYAFGEQFSQIGRGSIITTPPSATFSAQLAQGIIDGMLNYTKLNLKFEHSIKSRKLGETFINFSAGKTWGNLPYPYLYNARGSKAEGNVIWVANHFQTMGLYEFVSDQYSNLFLTHSFKNLLFKPKVAWFRPNVSIVQGITIGSLNRPEDHQGIEFKTLEKGFFESGLVIDNLLRKKVSKLFYVGAGIGVFKRWGANALPEQKDNWALKLVWNIGF